MALGLAFGNTSTASWRKFFGTPSLANRPVCTSLAFLAWCEAHPWWRLSEVSSARATNVYFAQSGNDSTGDGSIGNPYKSLEKMQRVLDDSTGDVCLFLNEGDNFGQPKWRACTATNGSTSIVLSVDPNVSTDCIPPTGGSGFFYVQLRNPLTGARQFLTATSYNTGTKTITTGSTVNAAGYTQVQYGQGLRLGKTKTTIKSYRAAGNTSRPGSKWRMTMFQSPYATASWVIDAGTTWKITDTNLTTFGGAGWVRVVDDVGNYPLRLASSQANCEATPGSWFVSGNTLYVNPYNGEVLNDGAITYQVVYKNYCEGIVIDDVDDILVRDGWIDGYGACTIGDTSFDAYGIHVRQTGSNRSVIYNCEAYYNGRHSITSTSPGVGGICTVLACKEGWQVNDGIATVFYSATSSQVGVIAYCTCVGGSVPTTGTHYTYANTGSLYYAHSNGTASFLLAYKNDYVPGPFQALGGKFTNTPTWATLPDVACFIVGEEVPRRNKHAFDPIWTNDGITSAGGNNPDNNTWVINCKIWHCDIATPSLGDRSMGFPSGNYLNCIEIHDWTEQWSRRWTTNRATTGGGTAGSVYDGYNMYYSAKLFHCPQHSGGCGIIGKLTNLNDGARDSAGNATSTGKIVASIVGMTEGSSLVSFIVGWKNSASNLKGNAYLNASLTDKTKTYGGYSNDPDITEISHWSQRPGSDTSLNLASPQLVEGYRLEYDMLGKPRGAVTSKGPFESYAN